MSLGTRHREREENFTRPIQAPTVVSECERQFGQLEQLIDQADPTSHVSFHMLRVWTGLHSTDYTTIHCTALDRVLQGEASVTVQLPYPGRPVCPQDRD